MDMLRLRDEEDLHSLKPDAWGIPSLTAEDVHLRENAMGGIGVSTLSHSERTKLDLVFMPGMAFDRAKRRLGHGKGFYDKYLSRLQQVGSGTPSLHERPVLSK